MTSISASAVASLRSRTGVSILLCKKALEENNGNEDLAIEYLRKQGMSQVAKKADRAQAEGIVFVAENKNSAAMLLLQCETDFVARDDTFQKVGIELTNILLNDGEEKLALMAKEKVPVLVQKLGENISISDIHLVKNNVVGTYVHSNGKIGVIIGLNGGSVEKAKNVAMHAAAMNPLYITPEEVQEEVILKEKEIWKEQLKKENKPDAIIEKIMIGKEKKFREENALIKQDFVKEPGQSVADYLAGLTVTHYKRVSVK